MKLDSLKDLLVEELSDLYDAESQLVKALPKMAKAAAAADLKRAFETHLNQTNGQVQRLEEVFSTLDEKPKRKTCKGMKGLIEEGEEMIKEAGDPAVKDAGLIGAAQRVEHYQMAGYGCARTYAEMLGEQNCANMLQTTLEEARSTDKRLTELAERLINVEAARA